jgi:hypothetical protein
MSYTSPLRWAVGLWFFGTLVLSAGKAQADPAADAQALFDEGRRLVNEGNYAAACPKFEESQRIDPATGTLLNLARCHAHVGRLASAWAEFRDVVGQATREGRSDRVEEARRQIAAIEPRLARLVVTVGVRIDGIHVRLDETELKEASWGTPIPVDPGRHDLTASAVGHVSRNLSIDLNGGEFRQIEIPALEDGPTPPILPQEGSPSLPASMAKPPVAVSGADRAALRDLAPVRPRSSGPPLAAYGLGAIGVASAALGAYFGIVALNDKNDSRTYCYSNGCTSRGASLLADANTAAWGSDVGFGVGLAALAGSAFWIWWSVRSTRQNARWTLGTSVAGAPIGLRTEVDF